MRVRTRVAFLSAVSFAGHQLRQNTRARHSRDANSASLETEKPLSQYRSTSPVPSPCGAGNGTEFLHRQRPCHEQRQGRQEQEASRTCRRLVLTSGVRVTMIVWSRFSASIGPNM